MRHRYSDFTRLAAEIVVVGMGTPEETRAFAAEQGLPFPLLCDPRRVSHRLYGLRRGSAGEVVGRPEIWWRGIANALRGRLPGKVAGDPMQLSGSFVIDPRGTIRFAERSRLSSQFAPVERLLEVVQDLGEGGEDQYP